MFHYAIAAALLALGAQAGDFAGTARLAAEARESNRIPEAISLYRRAVQLRPAWDEGWWYAGVLAYDQNRYAEARDALRRFLALKPDAAPGAGLLGLCEFETGEHAQALRDLSRAIDLGIAGSGALGDLVRLRAAALLAKFGQFDVALRLLSELGEERKSSPEIVRTSGIAALRMRAFFSEVKAAQIEMTDLAGRAALSAAAGEKTAAEKLFASLAERYPAAPNVHYLYGSFLAFVDPDRAAAEFQRELENAPDHVPALIALSLELSRRGESEAAVPHARKAAALARSDYAARFAFGRVLLGAGRAAEAAVELEAAARMQPGIPDTFFSLARAYQALGRRSDAGRARATFLRLRDAAKPQ